MGSYNSVTTQTFKVDTKFNAERNFRLTAFWWWNGISWYTATHGQSWLIIQSASDPFSAWYSKSLVKASSQFSFSFGKFLFLQGRLSSFILGYIAHFIFNWTKLRLLTEITHTVFVTFCYNFYCGQYATCLESVDVPGNTQMSENGIPDGKRRFWIHFVKGMMKVSHISPTVSSDLYYIAVKVWSQTKGVCQWNTWSIVVRRNASCFIDIAKFSPKHSAILSPDEQCVRLERQIHVFHGP